MKILSLSQIRSAETRAVTGTNKTLSDLMECAGKSTAKIIKNKYSVLGKKILIVCGNGNNGGDGLVVASELKAEGADVSLFFPFSMPDTDTAKPFIKDVSDIKTVNELPDEADIVVDALFGIGLNRKLDDNVSSLIEKMNDIDAVKIAIDIPSGVYCDGGACDISFKADLTVTFIALKLCFVLPTSSSFCGEVVVCDLGINAKEFSYETIEKPDYIKRDKNSHKGTFGTALLVCGSYGMCGAEILSAKSALLSGAGIVKAVVCDKNYSAFTSTVPEAVTVPVETALSGCPVVYDKTLYSSLSNIDALLIGCGLGRNDDSIKLVHRILENSNVPTVIDADGINAILGDISIIKRVNSPVIITPHPAEMARLFNTTVSDIEHNRIRYAKEFATENGCTVVLKGANTVVALPDGKIYFNVTGNPGMATAGSGDVLSGIIVSLLAQGLSPETAALNSVYIHGTAGDIAAQKHGEISMTASNIIEELPTVLK